MSVKPTLVELILNATAAGRSMLTAANAAAQKTLLSLVKGDVGLGNVDNTSDANKPVSTATQTSLDAKVTGPASATDNAIARFDATTGKLVQNCPVTINDSGMIQTNNAVGGGIDFGLSYGSITMFAGGQIAFRSAQGGLAGFVIGNSQGAFNSTSAIWMTGNLHGSYFEHVRINGGGTYANAQTAGNIYLHGGSNYAGGTNSNGGDAFLHGGAGSGSGSTGKTHLAWDGSAARGRVLVGTGTDDGVSMLQVAGAISLSGAHNLAPITKTALLLSTPNAATGGRWRVTDATPANRGVYPDGTVWRYVSDDTEVT